MNLHNSNIVTTFVRSRFVRAEMPELKGVFNFAPNTYGGVTHTGIKPKGIQSPDEGLDTVKGDAVCFVTLSKTSL